LNELLDVLLVKARLATGLPLSHDVKATHTAGLCGASAGNSGATLGCKWSGTSALALRVVRAGLATVCRGANTALSANKNLLDLAALCNTFAPGLGGEALDSILERDVSSTPDAGEKHTGNDEIVSEHV
jgi:hypothetical protein